MMQASFFILLLAALFIGSDAGPIPQLEGRSPPAFPKFQNVSFADASSVPITSTGLVAIPLSTALTTELPSTTAATNSEGAEGGVVSPVTPILVTTELPQEGFFLTDGDQFTLDPLTTVITSFEDVKPTPTEAPAAPTEVPEPPAGEAPAPPKDSEPSDYSAVQSPTGEPPAGTFPIFTITVTGSDQIGEPTGAPVFSFVGSSAEKSAEAVPTDVLPPPPPPENLIVPTSSSDSKTYGPLPLNPTSGPPQLEAPAQQPPQSQKLDLSTIYQTTTILETVPAPTAPAAPTNVDEAAPPVVVTVTQYTTILPSSVAAAPTPPSSPPAADPNLPDPNLPAPSQELPVPPSSNAAPTLDPTLLLPPPSQAPAQPVPSSPVAPPLVLPQPPAPTPPVAPPPPAETNQPLPPVTVIPIASSEIFTLTVTVTAPAETVTVTVTAG